MGGQHTGGGRRSQVRDQGGRGSRGEGRKGDGETEQGGRLAVILEGRALVGMVSRAKRIEGLDGSDRSGGRVSM